MKLNKQIIPRFKGSAYPIGKQWGFEVLVCIGTLEPYVLSFEKPEYLTLNKESAITRMKQEIPTIAKIVCEAIGLPQPSAFHNLKTNMIDDISEYENATIERDNNGDTPRPS
jgi:hypothetical protein